ncbi:hypothetical protein BLX24_24985 [Arsenicibacter rosenii]|uniref:SprT-like domain-containing protein n=2 Tax=Arsenicibacter rosenii TaxID=1750698 RepID=A0A1S2VDE3_9BACT|nr:hypothetical protein BLX24_24985 [Arsenicibacter rosenii]
MQSLMSDIERLANGSIGSIIQRFSNNNASKYNWKLKDGQLTPNTNAFTSQIFDPSTKTVTTTFDSQKFSQATDLSIARTIIHESIHAFLVNHFRVDPLTAQGQFPQLMKDYANEIYGRDVNAVHHAEFARNYVSAIASALAEFDILRGYTHPFQFYEDLAWGGLEGTEAFNNLDETVKIRISNRVRIELTGKDLNGNYQNQIGRLSDCH